MAIGYVLINVKPGMELQAFEIINTIENVAAADLLFGDYDIIVKIIEITESDRCFNLTFYGR